MFTLDLTKKQIGGRLKRHSNFTEQGQHLQAIISTKNNMAKYTKSTSVQGAWVKASELTNGTRAKLVSEVAPGQGEYGMQDVGKLRIEGDNETKNVRINKPTLNAFVEVFGVDSKEWINKPLTIHTEKMIVGGKRVVALYLLPENYELTEDSNGYMVITKKNGEPKAETEETIEYPTENVDPKDIPF